MVTSYVKNIYIGLIIYTICGSSRNNSNKQHIIVNFRIVFSFCFAFWFLSSQWHSSTSTDASLQSFLLKIRKNESILRTVSPHSFFVWFCMQLHVKFLIGLAVSHLPITYWPSEQLPLHHSPRKYTGPILESKGMHEIF